MKVIFVGVFLLAAVGVYLVKTVDWVTLQGARDAPSGVAEKALHIEDFRYGEALKVSLWFPEGECDEVAGQEQNRDQSEAMYCLADDARSDRVVVLSHGSRGSAADYRWLAYRLASQGYVVVGINHLLESWIYDRESQDPNATVKLWLRAQDVSSMVDRLAAMPLFQTPIDWTHLVGVGHSAGGQTMALLAGVRYEAQASAAYCASEASKNDKGCEYKWPKDAPREQWIPAFNNDYKDERFERLVLLDPGLGPAATEQSAQRMVLPTLVLGAVDNDFLPFAQHAARYEQLFPNAELVRVGDGAGHFIFIGACNHDYKAMGVPLCSDRPGVDRGAKQQDMAKRIVEFLAVAP